MARITASGSFRLDLGRRPFEINLSMKLRTLSVVIISSVRWAANDTLLIPVLSLRFAVPGGRARDAQNGSSQIRGTRQNVRLTCNYLHSLPPICK